MSVMYDAAKDYELLAQAVYQAIVNAEGIQNIEVFHNKDIVGRSDVAHQIDVMWRFKHATVEHLILVECKHYSKNVSLGAVRSFFGVVHDIGARGIMVTKVGFQDGATRFAKHYGIDLKLLRPPGENDWGGLIREVQINFEFKWPESSPDRPVVVQFFLSPSNDEMKARLESAQRAGQLSIDTGPDAQLLDRNGVPVTEMFRLWLPRQLPVLENAVGGPYVHTIDLKDRFIKLPLPGGGTDLVPVQKLEVQYFVSGFTNERVVIDGAQLVSAVLKDYVSGEVEHWHPG